MKVLFVTPESYPFATSGGLGDVSYALPKALRKRLIGCRVVMPLYRSVPQELRDSMTFLCSLSVPVSWRRQYCGVFEAKVDGVIYYLLDNQYYFNRDTLYGHYDDAERFAFFSRAVLEMLSFIDFKPDVIHCNDWQSALTPVYYSLYYAARSGYENIKTVFTIHNIQYQGQYGNEILEDVFGIAPEYASLVQYGDCVNLMKGAIESANYVTTVSDTYSKEILDPWFSHGLHDILRERRWKLTGIVNGIDTALYDPAGDPMIYAAYDEQTLEKKAANKAALQQELGLEEKPDVPLLSMVSRMVEHKGFDLVKYAMNELMQRNMQMVILGSGDWVFEDFFRKMAEAYPGKFALWLGFNQTLAHKVYAGSDMFLMPSKSEPCGLSQMVALRYGTVPIVRATGGLRDTIRDSGDNEGNGFVFEKYDAYDMLHAVDRALEGYSNPEGWQVLVRRAMQCDNSWGRSANEYIRLYKNLLK